MFRYGLASLFERYHDGYEFTEANTPLHLTHIDVFEIKLNPGQIINKLEQLLSNQPAFYLMPIRNDFLGPNKNIPVTLLELSLELKTFHKKIIRYLESENATFVNPHFLKEDYIPHISIYGNRRVETGQPVRIDSLSIGHKRTDIDSPPNRIIATIPFS